jgi:hypothetical protein
VAHGFWIWDAAGSAAWAARGKVGHHAWPTRARSVVDVDACGRWQVQVRRPVLSPPSGCCQDGNHCQALVIDERSCYAHARRDKGRNKRANSKCQWNRPQVLDALLGSSGSDRSLLSQHRWYPSHNGCHVCIGPWSWWWWSWSRCWTRQRPWPRFWWCRHLFWWLRRRLLVEPALSSVGLPLLLSVTTRLSSPDFGTSQLAALLWGAVFLWSRLEVRK